MTYHIEVNYEGKQGSILVVMFLEQINFTVGDLYRHSTHKTQFNPKIEHKLKDGVYRVSERKWIVHKADIHHISLFITITDI